TPAGPIALCVLTKENKDTRWADDNAGDMLCARIAEAVYEHFNPPVATNDKKTSATKSGGWPGQSGPSPTTHSWSFELATPTNWQSFCTPAGVPASSRVVERSDTAGPEQKLELHPRGVTA